MVGHVLSISKTIAEHFAESLGKAEVIERVKMLERKDGTVKDFCEALSVDKKTLYDLDKVKSIKLATKVKVLKKALEDHPYYTLRFIARKCKERTIDALSIYLTMLRDKVLSAKGEELNEIRKELNDVKEEFSYAPLEHLSEILFSIEEMLEHHEMHVRLHETFVRLSATLLGSVLRGLLSYVESSARNTSTIAVPSTPFTQTYEAPSPTDISKAEERRIMHDASERTLMSTVSTQ